MLKISSSRLGLISVFAWLMLNATLAWSAELSGAWQEYDDDTGKLAAIIRIEMLPDDTYEGRIEKFFSDQNSPPKSVCTHCKGELRGHPLLGLQLLHGMKRKGRLDFDGGEILDPDDGKTYRCHIRLSEDGESIEVTGYISLNWIGQSEIWRRSH